MPCRLQHGQGSLADLLIHPLSRLDQRPQIGQDSLVAGAGVLAVALVVDQLDVVEKEVGELGDRQELVARHQPAGVDRGVEPRPAAGGP